MAKKKEGHGKKFSVFILIPILVVLLDQLVKFIIRRYFQYTKNYGAGFGILQGQRWPLIAVAVIVIGIIFYYYRTIPEKGLAPWSVALVLGGIIGNLIDRLVFGYVTDFIRIWIWPSFNIADAASTIGVIGLIIYMLKKK